MLTPPDQMKHSKHCTKIYENQELDEYKKITDAAFECAGCLQILIDNGADFDCFDKYGRSCRKYAMYYACRNNADAVDILLDNGFGVDEPCGSCEENPIKVACEFLNNKAVDSLIEHGCKITDAAFHSCMCGRIPKYEEEYVEIMKKLITAGGKPPDNLYEEYLRSYSKGYADYDSDDDELYLIADSTPLTDFIKSLNPDNYGKRFLYTE